MTSPHGANSKKAAMTTRLLLLLAAAAALLRAAQCYKPVIVVHGLFDSPGDMHTLHNFINESHPGTNVTIIDLFDRTGSLKSLWSQVEGFKQAIYPIMQNAADGVHMICYSQGGLICRGIISTMNNHNVDTLVSLSAPLLGQYGDTDYLKWFFPKYVKTNLYRFCYSQFGQHVSICNYWNDPHHHDLYLSSNNYLAFLNNERDNPNATDWKNNFLRLHQLVLIGGPDDGVITPWQSSHFGFYNENETVLEMKKQLIYRKDTFGLKTMDARKAITTFTMTNVHHTEWHSNKTVFDKCIVKWLT